MLEATLDRSPRRRTNTLVGGGLVEETWHSPVFVTVALSGDIDVFDAVSMVDLTTGWVLEGARYVAVDASGVTFVDLVVLQVLDRARRHLDRSGGVLEIGGLRPSFDRVWRIVAGTQPIATDRRDPDPEPVRRSDQRDPGPTGGPPPIAA